MSKNTYVVSWSVTKYYYVSVKAEDEEEARQEAFDSDPHHDSVEVHDIDVGLVWCPKSKHEVQGSEVVDA